MYVDLVVLKMLFVYIGIDVVMLQGWWLDVVVYDGVGMLLFLIMLLVDKGLLLGVYDGCVMGIYIGIVVSVDLNLGGNDLIMMVVFGVYIVMWNIYLNDDLKFMFNFVFMDLNDQVFCYWDFCYIDLIGVQKGFDVNGNVVFYIVGDLVVMMSLNVDLKVFFVNGYYDFVMLFYQIMLDLKVMLLLDVGVCKNLLVGFYLLGYMVYLDGGLCMVLKVDLVCFYDVVMIDYQVVVCICML